LLFETNYNILYYLQVILDNYAKCIQTVSELEDHLNEDQLKKKNDILKKESEKLEREITNLHNDNEKLMSSVSKVRMTMRNLCHL